MRCSQAKCPVAITGACLEGHSSGCPHLLPETVAPPETAETSIAPTKAPLVPEPFRFHSGEKLTSGEATRILSAVPAKLVFFAGPQWAGKTTFLAKIGELFRNGAFSELQFAGSQTLCAFERITWLATIASGAGQPDTKRTHRVEKDTFFHLRVQSANAHKDVLISDLPGEVFPALLSNREVCEEQLSLARADHLVLFIDCQALTDKAKRHAERDMAIRFLSQIKSCRKAPEGLPITVIFSRWDYVTNSDEKQQHENYCDIVEQDIRSRFEAVFSNLHFHRVAARPAHTPPTDGEIQAIFWRWLQQLPKLGTGTPNQYSYPTRDFCAFGS